MNILDENIPEGQRQLLRSWRCRCYQIGDEVGRMGMGDEEIITLLVAHKHCTFITRDPDFYDVTWIIAISPGCTPAFITRDPDFYDVTLCHARYCIVRLDVMVGESASFARRVLRHSHWDTEAKRRGKVIRASHIGMHYWQIRSHTESFLPWR